MKRIAILGASGSIGQQTFSVCLENFFEVKLITLNKNWQAVLDRIYQFHPLWIYVSDSSARKLLAEHLKSATFKTNFEQEKLPFVTNNQTPILLDKEEDLQSCFRTEQLDIVVGAVVGIAGLKSIFWAAEAGLDIALANKESLVVAGNLLKTKIRESKSKILPVDSEHAAIFQCLLAGEKKEIRRIFLTASGGPFRLWSEEEIKKATVKEALNHPTWQMGQKITIDSASLMNKGLEWIEAVHLFEVKPEQVEIIIHPQSQVHSMLEWQDGSVLAEIGLTDMKRPISQALFYPQRSQRRTDFYNPFLATSNRLEFYPPDFHKFPCLSLAKRAMAEIDFLPIVLNAANEVAVAKFLHNEISFGQIPQIIENSLNYFAKTGNEVKKIIPSSLDNIIAFDQEVKDYATDCL